MSRLPQKLAISSDAIDAVLPQTQCTRCGYPACRPYADAIARGEALINQCPPGGDDGIRQLSQLTGLPYAPLNPQNGVEGPRKQALIDEHRCIGCKLCLLACPVDAIVGGFKFMHTVIAEDCTGCELCVAPCPVDCIEMTMPAGPLTWSPHDANRARQQFMARAARLEKPSVGPASPPADQLTAILARAQQRGAERAK